MFTINLSSSVSKISYFMTYFPAGVAMLPPVTDLEERCFAESSVKVLIREKFPEPPNDFLGRMDQLICLGRP